MPFLTNKVALVTGASRGIGRAIALRLAQEGARVVLTARDESLLQEAVAQIRKDGGEADALALDLRVPEAAPQLVEFALRTFGTLDIVVNNAGATKRGDFVSLDENDWQDGFALKFFGAVRLLRAAWPHLKTSGGHVVNIAGVGGRTPGASFSIGGSVNAAILSLTKSLADLGIADGVQVNAINPGPIRTDRFQKRLDTVAREQGVEPAEAEKHMIHELGVTRIGEPDDIAHLVAFLVSPQGQFLQGSLIDIDGGKTKTL